MTATTTRAHAAFVTTAYLLLTATACTSHHPTHPPLPTIDVVRPPLTSSPPPSGHPPDQSAAVLQVVRLTLPLDADTETAWALTNPALPDPTATETWRDNGIRVALLKRKHLDRFQRELPALTRNAPTQWITLNALPTPLPVSPTINHTTIITITHPAQPPRTIRLTSGRLRFLTRVTDITQKEPVLEWTPQLYKPRVTVQPRQPQEKNLDGLVFSSLTLLTPARPNQLVVIGLHAPSSPNPNEIPDTQPPNPGDAAQIPDTQPASDAPIKPPTTQPTPPNLPTAQPNNLGRHMFIATRFGRPVQTILLIAVTP